MHLAELNVGRLLADPEDPRVAEFTDNIQKINALGMRMPGFVWMMEGDGDRCVPEAVSGEDPRFIANLTVWEDVASLEHFVWNTLHKQFYARKNDWFEILGQPHFVMWWVAPGHRPTLDEALARLEHLRAYGPSDHAFGWDWLQEARLHKAGICAEAAE